MINNILYSDEISHDDTIKKIIGEHKTSSIPNIEEEQLSPILEIIFKSNPGISFKLIEYSKKNKTLVFYTDKELSLKEYFEYYKKLPKTFQYKPLISKTDILNEIKDILNSNINTDNNCISLYDVLLLIRHISNDIKNLKNEYKKIFENSIKHSDGYIIIFDYYKNELTIEYNIGIRVHRKIKFSKIDNDLFIKDTDYQPDAQEFLVKSGNAVSELYDKLEQYRPFYTQETKKSKAINSNFSINITNNEIKIYTIAQIHQYDFSIKATNKILNNDFIHSCNSNNILNEIIGQENEIFKRIFIKISNCPEWSQPLLTNIRKKQLEEMRKNDETKPLKNKKTRTLLKKICPFIQWG